MENLLDEVRKLTSSFEKLESELEKSKNITTVLSGRHLEWKSKVVPMLNTHRENVWKL